MVICPRSRCPWQLGARLLLCREVTALREHCRLGVLRKIVIFVIPWRVGREAGSESPILTACLSGRRKYLITAHISDGAGGGGLSLLSSPACSGSQDRAGAVSGSV